LPLPHFIPADLKLIRDAFDHDAFIYELKMDGFRALAHVGPDETRLVSRKGNEFKSFPALAAAIHIDLDCQAVLDGEIVILDSDGRPQFYELLKRRGRGERGSPAASIDRAQNACSVQLSPSNHRSCCMPITSSATASSSSG